MSKRVAVVTGSNKGIGFGIVRGLCKEFDGDVFLTARDEGRGQKAVDDLKAEGLNPKFHLLDITDKKSIEKLGEFLKETYGGLDVLVNNAAIAYRFKSDVPFNVQAENTLKTNFFGTMDVCDTLFPLLRAHARVVNISSESGFIALKKCSPEKQQRFLDPNITSDEVKQLMRTFVEDTKDLKHEEKGWANMGAGTAKIGITVMTIIQQRDCKIEDVLINAADPGHVDTDMSAHKGPLTIDEGAVTPVYLATLPPNTTSPKGNFVFEKKIKPWGLE